MSHFAATMLGTAYLIVVIMIRYSNAVNKTKGLPIKRKNLNYLPNMCFTTYSY